MLLSETFTNGLRSGSGVTEALAACDQELKKRLKGRLESEDILRYFFNCPKAKAHRQELMNFWDVYRPYADQVSLQEKKDRDIFILDCVYEVDGISHCDLADRLTADWTPEEKQRQKRLRQMIKEYSDTRYICFFRGAEDGWQETCRLELNKLMARMETFGFHAVDQKLIEYMEQGGAAVVVRRPDEQGRINLTAISLGGRDYRVLDDKEAEELRPLAEGASPADLEEYYPKGDRDELGAIIEQGDPMRPE